MIQRSRTQDAIALVILITVIAGASYGYWRLARWRDAATHSRAAEIERCKAACDRPRPWP